MSSDPEPRLPAVDPDLPPQRIAAPPHTRAGFLALVGLGGLVGAAMRHRLGVWFPHSSGTWPVTTFAVNIGGAFLLGLLLEAMSRMGPDTGWRLRARLGLGTGVLGAFTTYSTLAVDIDLLLRAHRWTTAATYAGATVLTGLLAAIAGMALGARTTRRARQ